MRKNDEDFHHILQLMAAVCILMMAIFIWSLALDEMINESRNKTYRSPSNKKALR